MNILVRLTQQLKLQSADQTGSIKVRHRAFLSADKILRENILYDQLMNLRFNMGPFSLLDIDTSFHPRSSSPTVGVS